MRLPAAILASLLLLAACPLAEDKPSQATPTISSRSELVLVPTLVREKSGKPVAGLPWSDFTLLENGTERKIAVFEEVTTSTARPRRQSSPAGEFTNYLVNEPAPSRVTIIVMDSINTQFADRAYAHDEILKFLKEMAGSNEPIALLLLDREGVRVIHDFTTDPAVLAKALRQLQTGTGAPVADSEESLADPSAAHESQRLTNMMQNMEQNYLAGARMEAALLTLDGLQQIARAYGAIPGRKSVIWASGGFPFSIDNLSQIISSGTVPTPSYMNDILPRYERTWQILNDANIALYPVDVRGLVTLAPSITSHGRRSSWLGHMDTISTFREFASMTGGKAYVNTNDLTHAFHDAIEDSASYYMLGFYLPSDDRKPGWRKLQVKVKQTHLQVRARSGFYVMPEDKDKDNTKYTDMALAMSSPLNFTSLPIQARWIDTMPNGPKTRATFELLLAADAATVDESDHNHLSVDFEAVAREPTGKIVADNGRTVEGHLRPETVAKVRSSGITYKGGLDLPPGEYSVRFVVRDNLSGRVGSVAAPLTIH